MSRIRFPLIAITVIAVGVIAVIVATSGASSTKAFPSTAAASAISVKQTSLGPTLVDADGRTLYLFEGDRPNVSSLSAAGQAVWPPFTATIKPRALNHVTAAGVATIGHARGTAQVTYDDHPLYYYIGDRSSGQVRGQGLNQFGALLVRPRAEWQSGHLSPELARRGIGDRRLGRLRLLSRLPADGRRR
jgi:predicted lipoprotein with Yx(FWY)xxD motif